MRLSDDALKQVEEVGFVIVPGFIGGTELEEAQLGLWNLFPRPEVYFADPDRFPEYRKSQIAGMHRFPYASKALNRLSTHPDLVDAARRYFGSSDLHLYKIELWAKYGGATKYDQPLHRDFVNHSLTVPTSDKDRHQLTSFIYLSDVGMDDGPTRIVPLSATKAVPYNPAILKRGDLLDDEVAVCVPAGSLLLYRTDVLHRGSELAPISARFALLVDFQRRGYAWTGKVAWPDRAVDPMWPSTFAELDPKERGMFGFPLPGDEFWTEQTIRDTAERYPEMNMEPYLAHVRVGVEQ